MNIPRIVILLLQNVPFLFVSAAIIFPFTSKASFYSSLCPRPPSVQLHPIGEFLFLDFVCSMFTSVNAIISNSELYNIQVTVVCQNAGFPGITHIWRENLALVVDTEH